MPVMLHKSVHKSIGEHWQTSVRSLFRETCPARPEHASAVRRSSARFLIADFAEKADNFRDRLETHGRSKNDENVLPSTGLLPTQTVQHPHTIVVVAVDLVWSRQAFELGACLTQSVRQFASPIHTGTILEQRDDYVALLAFFALMSIRFRRSCSADSPFAAMSEARADATWRTVMPEPQGSTPSGNNVDNGGYDMESISEFKEIWCDQELADELQAMVDGTQFCVVKHCLRSPETPIEAVLLLREEYQLSQLASVCVQGGSRMDCELRRLFRSRALSFAGDWLPSVEGGISRIHIDSIPDELSCSAIYLPPAYLVQIRAT